MITSKGNAWFKRVRRAIRDHEGEIVIEGPKAVHDAIAAGWKPIAVMHAFGARPLIRPPGTFSPQAGRRNSNALAPRSGERVAEGRVRGAPYSDYIFSPELFREIADTKTSQGVIGLFERPRWTAEQILARRDSIAIALDGVQDPGNAGTIVRLAAAFGAAGVILLPGCADPFGPKAIRASAGAILSVPVACMTLDALLSSEADLYAADGAAEESDVPARAAVLVFGGEGGGVSPALRSRAKGIAVRTSGRVESLNVAAAAAILLWRSFRSRTGHG